MTILESQTVPPAAWTAFRLVLLSQLRPHIGSILMSSFCINSVLNKQRHPQEEGLFFVTHPRKVFVFRDLISHLTDTSNRTQWNLRLTSALWHRFYLRSNTQTLHLCTFIDRSMHQDLRPQKCLCYWFPGCLSFVEVYKHKHSFCVILLQQYAIVK